MSKQNRRCVALATIVMLASTAVGTVSAFAEEVDLVGSDSAATGVPTSEQVVSEQAASEDVGPTAEEDASAEPPADEGPAPAEESSSAPEPEVEEPSTPRPPEATPEEPGVRPIPSEPAAEVGMSAPATPSERAVPTREVAPRAAACVPGDRSAAIDSLELTAKDGSSELEAWEIVRLTFAGSLPDGGCTGDTITINLPDSLEAFAGTFPVLAEDGTPMGTMEVGDGQAVITFNDYVETHEDIRFEGFLELQVTSVMDPDTEYELEFPVGDEVIRVPVSTGPCPGCDGPKWAGKSANMELGDPNYIKWNISTAATQSAGEVIVITDTLGPGQEFDCSQLQVQMSTTRDAWGSVIWSETVTGRATFDCDPADSTLTMTITATAPGQYYLLGGRAFVMDVLDSYTDTGTVTQSGETRGVWAEAKFRSGGVNGNGTGRNPHIDIEKWSTDQGPVEGDHDEAPGKTLDPSVPEALTFTIVNDGRENLIDVVVSDSTTAGTGVVTDLSCDFSPLGGPSEGLTWDGPFLIGDSFTCTGTLPALGSAATHTNLATVAATGEGTKESVEDEDPWTGTTPEDPEPGETPPAEPSPSESTPPAPGETPSPESSPSDSPTPAQEETPTLEQEETSTPEPSPTQPTRFEEPYRPDDVPPSSTGGLPNTGADAFSLMAGVLGGLLLLVGSGLVRRRRSER